MSLKNVTPQQAQSLIKEGAVLIDIRDADEYAREHIAQAQHLPMKDIKNRKIGSDNDAAVIFHCRSGNRTQVNTASLEASTSCETYILEGGLDAWKKAGLPVIADTSQPLELNRQVQIAAGSVIVLGAVLGVAISPWFHVLSAFVGAGLVFAGLSGFCGLARVLMKMPWNRRSMAA